MAVQFKGYGWATLRLVSGSQRILIHCSHVFDPFPDLVRWLGELQQGILPTQMRVDEEGRDKWLFLLPLEDPSMGRFEVRELEQGPAVFQARVRVEEVTEAFRHALRSAFETSYDPGHWGTWTRGEDGLTWGEQLRRWMLAHPILQSRWQ